MTIHDDAVASAPLAEDSAAADFLQRNRQRRKTRRWIGYASLPVILAVMVLVAKLLSMYAAAHMAIAAHLTGDGSGAARAAQWQYPLNFFEPFKAPFNNGVGLSDNGQYPAARAEFEKALDLVTGLEECAVRINLSLTIEHLGDAKDKAGDAYAAKKLYDEAMLALLEGPKDCNDPKANESSSDPNRDVTQQQQQQQERLKQKQDEQEQKQNPQPDPGNPDPEPQPNDPKENGPSEGQLEKLKEQLESGQQERDDIGRDDDPWSENETDKPW